MTQSINTSLVRQFSDMVHLDAQQMSSRLKGKVDEKRIMANEFTYERLSAVEAIEVTTRNAQTVAQDITHARRGTEMRDFRTTILLDQFDDLQVLIDPTRGYTKSVAKSLMRVYDDLCLEAALGSIRTGRNIDTTVTAAADGVQTIAAGGSGLTYEKLLQINENFMAAGVSDDMNMEVYLACGASQITDLMQEVEVTSKDFRPDTVIDKGTIMKAAGINLVVFPTGSNINNPLLGLDGNTRTCVAWANDMTESGICIGVNKDIDIKINERPDLNNSKQIQATFFAGAIRTEGVRVQAVEALES